MICKLLCGQNVAWCSESAAGYKNIIDSGVSRLSGMNFELLCGQKVVWCSESAAG